ncbi:hypothetical protein R5R35_009002 [Gryllus longicercus]|uniref:Uncharacterized protein n=1 Tax=Gryllus longicercus TaxID=2509291 RepID=A0AAN9VBA8_9ORTH
MGVLIEEPLEVEQVPKRRKGLNKCCCSCSLQAGCIIIGTLTTFHGLGAFLASLFTLIFGGGYMFGNTYSNVGVRLCIMLVIGILHFATGVSLIYGADKRRPSFMKFWLFTQYVEFSLLVAAAVISFIISMVQGVPVGAIWSLLAYFTVVVGIFVYCIAVVQGFCREVMESENNKRYLKAEI